MKNFFIFLALFIFIGSSVNAAPLPIEYFSNSPDVSSMQLSPNGEKLFSVIRIDVGETKGNAIQVSNMQSGKKELVLFTDNSKYFIGRVWWKDNNTLLAHTWYPSDRDTWVGFRQARFKTREVRLLIINTETGEVKSPFKKNFLKKYKILPNQLGTVIDSLHDDPEHILMSVPGMERGYAWYPTVVKININNLRKKTLQNSEERIWGWEVDQQKRVRLSYRRKDEMVYHRIKDLKTEKWQELWAYEIFSEEETDILGFDNDPNILYLSAYHEGFKAIFKVDLSNKSMKKELVYSDPNYDVRGYLIRSPKTRRVIGIGNGIEEGTKYIDPEYRKLQDDIDKALPNTRNFIGSITKDENKYLVFSIGPKESGTYYLGTRNPTKLKAIAYGYNNLPPDVLADVNQVNYKARDGIEIEAFLTLPNGKEAKNLPTIIYPHGGPISRSSNTFDSRAQFFANKGYAVLQMNFRGSDGQGLEFRNSGLKNWGKEMQDDIEDGAAFLINKGISDPKKICIVGGSYGGYAALMGVAKTPDRYKCAISINGVSNVFDLVKDNRVFWRSYNVVDEQIGNDNKTLKEISPVNHAKKITAPVLLIHGELDRQVDIKHSYQMRDALLKAKKDVTFVELPGEDHSLKNQKMRLKAYKAMDEFLNKHLPVN